MPRPAARPLANAAALAGLVALLAAAPASAADLPPVRSVARVDLQRYAGKWYEIAAFPMFFQRHCLGDTTAEYTQRPDGGIAVLNRCRDADGFEQAAGRAWPARDGDNAQLKVSFFWPFRSDYWIIGLDPDYRWAVVGNPNRKYLWILSRTPRLAPAELQRALRIAADQGYDLGRLKYTRQTETAQ